MLSLTEKHRPKKYDDVIGQDKIIEALRNERPDSRPHKLFLGPPGTGKTTVAQIYANEIGFPMEEMNASDERKIGDVRGKIKQLASFTTNRIIFLDEGDSLTSDAQNALRRIIERTQHTIFIISGNYPHKIIEAIKSRCSIYYFNRIPDNLVLRQILSICKKEGISIEPDSREGFLEIIKQSGGDMRKAINTLEIIVGEGKAITQKSVKSYQRPNIALDVLRIAYNGNFMDAQKKLEDEYISSGLDPKRVIEDMFQAIGTEIPKNEEKAMLYRELARTERACRQENSPIVQLTGFVAYAWLVPNFNAKCPVLEG